MRGVFSPADFRSIDKRVYITLDIMSEDTVACTAGKWTEFGRTTGIYGQVWDLGYDVNRGQNDSLGRAYAEIKSTTAVLSGTVRIMRYDSNDLAIDKVYEGHTSELDATADNRLTQVVFPVKNKFIGEDSSFVWFFKPDGDTDVTISKADTTMSFDGMRYNM